MDSKINLNRHLVTWALITIYLCILDPVHASLAGQIVVTFLIMVNYILVFYAVSLFIFPRFWNKNFFYFALAILTVYGVFTLNAFINFNYLLPFFGGDNFIEGSSTFQIIGDRLFPFTLGFVPAVGYHFFYQGIEKTRIQNEREKSLLLKELNFLKNQFNSHITFNFLNYCYSKIHLVSQDTADAIELFSTMLRYSLEIRPNEKVPIEKEIDYINNFIALQKLLTAHLFVNFTCKGDLTNKVILPRILITFIENAFKHGQLNSATDPIEITLNGNGDAIYLKVSNKKNNRKNIPNTGVGQENVTQILQLYYPDSHKLTIQDTLDKYCCELNLKLSA